MSDSLVLVHDEGAARTLTLNRPKALNALDPELTAALRDAVFAAEADRGVRVLVLKGGEHFMAGGDLKWFRGLVEGHSTEENRIRFERFINEVHPVILSLRRMPKPVIASVNGAAAGFGLSLVLACDLALASEAAYFTLAYSLIGVSPDGGSTFALPRTVGLKKAMEIALLGDRFGAQTARELGIVNQVVPASELDAQTQKLAARLATGPTAVYGRTKALLNGSSSHSLETQLQREAESFARCAAEPDFLEGLSAFIEKRKARFSGQ